MKKHRQYGDISALAEQMAKGKQLYVLRKQNLLLLNKSMQEIEVCCLRKRDVNLIASAMAKHEFSQTNTKQVHDTGHGLGKPGSSWKEKFSQVTLVLTTECNLACKYCIQGAIRNTRENLTPLMAMNAIRNFRKFLSSDNLTIVFYGGEPLLRFSVMEDIVHSIKKQYLSKRIKFTIFTNGTQITNRIARFFLKNDFFVIVSLDGPREINDLARTTKNRKGTFDMVDRGLCILRDYKCNFGISCTLGTHNASSLEYCVEYLICRYKPLNIGINFPHIFGQDKTKLPEVQTVSAVLETWKTCREYGVDVFTIGRKVLSLISCGAISNECSARGGRLVVFPNGSVGPCEGGLVCPSMTTQETHSSSRLFDLWSVGCTCASKSECTRCYARVVCGGGCALDSLCQTGSLENNTNYDCVLSQMFMNYCVDEILGKTRLSPGESVTLENDDLSFLWGKVSWKTLLGKNKGLYQLKSGA